MKIITNTVLAGALCLSALSANAQSSDEAGMLMSAEDIASQTSFDEVSSGSVIIPLILLLFIALATSGTSGMVYPSVT